MREIDADALKINIVAEGQRNRRYKLGEIWELNGAEIFKVIDKQPTIEPEQKTCKGCMWEDAYGYGNCPNCSRAYREDLYQPMT